MRQLVLVLFFATAMAGNARANCAPYVDLLESWMLHPEAGVRFLRHTMETMHHPGYDLEDRANAANYLGFFLILLFKGAEDRGLDELRKCTQKLYSGLAVDLPTTVEAAFSAGWAGGKNPLNTEALSVVETQKQVRNILLIAEKIAAGNGEVPPIQGEDPPTADASIIGEWQGVALSLVINGKSQKADILGPLTIEADGRYRVDAEPVFVDTGRWHLDDSFLTFETDQPADKTSIAWTVSFHDDQMWWEATRHNGQWSEKWVWKR